MAGQRLTLTSGPTLLGRNEELDRWSCFYSNPDWLNWDFELHVSPLRLFISTMIGSLVLVTFKDLQSGVFAASINVLIPGQTETDSH